MIIEIKSKEEIKKKLQSIGQLIDGDGNDVTPDLTIGWTSALEWVLEGGKNENIK